MKRYYIPTSSLNFNNVLSSESISPYAFYARRTFGYHRWIKTEENPNDNVTVLYPSLKYFSRPASDLEDHPMIIEVWLHKEEADTMLAYDDLLLCDHTIYLTPFSSKFIFFNETDKKIALSLSASSVETKYSDLYSRSRIAVVQLSEQKDEGIENNFPDVTFNESALTFDTAINKMKGLLFGYYIGHLLSTDETNIKQINTYRRVRDIFAAILSSIDREPTLTQMDNLLGIFFTMSSLYPDFMNEVKDRNIGQRLFDILRRKHYYSLLDSNLDELLYGLKKKSYNDTDNTNPSMKWINNKISAVDQEMHRKATKLSVENPQILVGQCRLIDIKNVNLQGVDKKLFMSWVNDIFSHSNYNGKISTFNEELSDEITWKAKEMFSSDGQWDDSKAKIILNGLRRHIRGSEFEHSWGNDLYSAMTAVLTNGDDWQKLLLFMQGKGMTDYSIPFAIYGVLNGFAGLPRDFTDKLFLCDSKYLESIYEEFYGELFDMKLPREDKVIRIENSLSKIEPKEQIEKGPFASSSKVLSVTGENTPSLQQDDEFEIFFDEIVKKFKSAERDKAVYGQHYTKFGMTEALLAALSDDKNINKGKGLQKGLRKFIESMLKSKQKEKKRKSSKYTTQIDDSKSLFDTTVQSTGLFLTDFDYLSSNSEFKAIVGVIPKWQEDLKWFIDSHNPEHSDYKYYSNKPTDNQSVIKQFVCLHDGRYAAAKDFLFKVYLNR